MNPFANQQAAALAVLSSGAALTRRAGCFLGQLVVDPSPMSEAQAKWLDALLDRAGLPLMKEDVNNG